MSKNIDQIYIANPITSNAQTDLMYFGQSPYGPGDDAGMLFSKFVAPFQSSQFNLGTDTGIADAYIVNLTPAPAALTDGFLVNFIATNANTIAAPTIDINSLTGNGIFLETGLQLLPNDIDSGASIWLRYDSNIDGFILLNPSVSEILIEDVIGGRVFYVVDSGTDDDYVGTLTRSPHSTTGSGALIAMNPSFSNVGSPTLNLNGQGAQNITLSNGDNLASGDIASGRIALLLQNVDSTYFLINPEVSFITAAEVQKAVTNVGTDTGAADAYAVDLTPNPGSYTNGLKVIFTPSNANTITTPTLTVNALGVKTIVLSSGALQVGDLDPSMIAECVYSVAADAFVLETPKNASGGGGGGGLASASANLVFSSLSFGQTVTFNSPVVLDLSTAVTAAGFSYSNSVTTKIDFSSLTTLTNNGFSGFSGTFPSLTDFDIPLLSNMNTYFGLTADALTTFSAPSLTNILSFNLSSAGLTSFSAPVLATVGSMQPTLSAITSFDLSSATNIHTLTGTYDSLTSLDVSGLTTNASMTFSAMVLTTFSLPAILNITDHVNLTTPALTTFSMNSGLLQVAFGFAIKNAALDQASVDGILVSLSLLDGTGGTTSYDNNTVDLTGGTSSTPSATGLAAKVVLEGRGNTVNVN